MELKPNMFVRTIYGIAKIIEFSEAIGKRGFWLDANINTDNMEGYENYCTVHDIIGNPSFDIIDLIEEGDYVNGHLVTKISTNGFVWLEGYSVDGTWKCIDFINEWGDGIKSIVTKEQFESMSYKVED